MLNHKAFMAYCEAVHEQQEAAATLMDQADLVLTPVEDIPQGEPKDWREDEWLNTLINNLDV